MRCKSTMFYCCFCLAALNLESFFPGWDALICGEQISAVCKIQETKEVRQLCQQYIDGFTKDILGTILWSGNFVSDRKVFSLVALELEFRIG